MSQGCFVWRRGRQMSSSPVQEFNLCTQTRVFFIADLPGKATGWLSAPASKKLREGVQVSSVLKSLSGIHTLVCQSWTSDPGKFSSWIENTCSCSCSYSQCTQALLRAHFSAENVSCCYADEHWHRKHGKQPFSQCYLWQGRQRLFPNFPGKVF